MDIASAAPVVGPDPPAPNRRVTSFPERANEGELIRQICAGETEHFYHLIRPYERAVFSTAYGILGNEADAEDVAQEVFLKAPQESRQLPLRSAL